MPAGGAVIPVMVRVSPEPLVGERRRRKDCHVDQVMDRSLGMRAEAVCRVTRALVISPTRRVAAE